MNSDSTPILAGLLTKEEFAREIKAHSRTVDNYRKLPDGLPSLTVAGKVNIPSALAREWLARRVVTPNPTRKVG